MSKGRVEALSDGIFAVAMTILIFNVDVPKGIGSGQLLRALLDEWPSYAAYMGSFLTIGVIWVNHHSVFERLVAMDRALLFINLLLLLVVVFVPFPTSLLGHYIQSGGDSNTAATVYALNFVLVAVFFSLLWAYALTHPGLLRPGFDRSIALKQLPRFSIGFAVYLICIPLAQLSPTAVVGLCALLAVYYMRESLPELRTPAAQEVDRDVEVLP